MAVVGAAYLIEMRLPALFALNLLRGRPLARRLAGGARPNFRASGDARGRFSRSTLTSDDTPAVPQLTPLSGVTS